MKNSTPIFLILSILFLEQSCSNQISSIVNEQTKENLPSEIRLPNGEPILRMPFKAGTVVVCSQGNNSPKGYSHHQPNCKYALDLTNLIEGTPIIAPFSGKVMETLTGAQINKGDSASGWGLGNYVLIDHGFNYYGLYGHFKEVIVKPNQIIKCGDPMGYMGETGLAGTPHLHFSLYYGHPGIRAIPTSYPSIPIHGLITIDLTDQYKEKENNKKFNLYSSLELISDLNSNEGCHLYGSENAFTSKYTLDKVPQSLTDTLNKKYDELLSLIKARKTRF